MFATPSLGRTPAALALAAAALLGSSPTAALAQTPHPQRPRPLPATAPRLVVVITVDQMRADYLERFRPQFTGGLARLLTGAVFTDAYQDHAMTETAVGHATILAGRNPASHGIVDNALGVGDPSFPLIGGIRGPGASPRRFKGTALFDWLAARSPGSRMLSISRKDRGAILPVGRAKQMVFWFANGDLTTSTYYADSLPAWVREVNARDVPVHAAGRVWEPLLPADSYPEPDAAPWENGGRDIAFPHELPVDTLAAQRAFLLTPWMDQLILDAALAGAGATRLGRGRAPDILAVSLSTTDAIGHTWGPDSRELHDQIVRLDRALGTFLDSLAKLVDPRRTVVALTADHGVTPFPGWSRAHGWPLADTVDLYRLVVDLRDELNQRLGPGDWIRFADLGLLALDRPALAAHGVNVDSLVDSLAAAVRREHGVLRVDTPRSLAAADTAQDAIARRWRNTVPPGLGAELMVTLQPKFVFGSSTSAEHGQPSDDDTHVPLVLWGPGIRPGRYAQRVSVVDLAPTLAALLGVQPVEPVQGRVLQEALGTPRRGR